jgi:hypothetical protein
MRRLARFDAAIAAFRAARASAAPPVIETFDLRRAGARLREVARAAPGGALVLAYQTLVLEYLRPDERAEYLGGMRELVSTSPPRSVLWVELEMTWDGENATGARVTAHARAEDGRVADLVLARCGYHPIAVEPDRGAVARFESLFST